MEKEIILTSKSELENLIQNSIRKELAKQGIGKSELTENYLSIKEACKYLRLAQNTIYGFTSKRLIPFIKKGKKLYFKKSDLDKWLETGRKQTKEEIEKGI